jgi:hypothetical protein
LLVKRFTNLGFHYNWLRQNESAELDNSEHICLIYFLIVIKFINLLVFRPS